MNNSTKNIKEYISNIINRLISEKYLYTSISKTEDNKNCIKLNIIEPEWFIELDDEIKYQVDYNIKKLYNKLILDEVNNMFSTFDIN